MKLNVAKTQKKLSSASSQGAYVQIWAPVGNLWRKQTTELVVFRGPEITRKVMLPSDQRRIFQPCMKTRLWFKIVNIFVVCISHTTKLAANANRDIIRLRTCQSVSCDFFKWKRGSFIIPLCVWGTPSTSWVFRHVWHLKFITQCLAKSTK